MSAFDVKNYGAAAAELLSEPRLNPLGPGTPNEGARAALDSMSERELLAGADAGNAMMARACLAGLWLYHDFLEESHRISQEIETPTGSYWHGIMHRREPDFSNSAYWFRRVGRHPVFDDLKEEGARIAESNEREDSAEFLTRQSAWDPFAFNDLCQSSIGTESSTETLCRQIQRREWELLFDFCYRGATRS